jgi:uncharacterized protein HemX
MEKQKKKGLLALLGIGAGVFAWWKYKNMSHEKKEELHSKVNDVGQKVKDTFNDVSQKVKETVNDVETTVKDKYDQIKNGAENKVDEMK